MAGGVRQDRRNAIRGTRRTILVRLRLRAYLRIMEQQIAMFLQQDRLRQNGESSEQVRQLLEVHRTVGQMLEERTNRTEAERERNVSGWWQQCGQDQEAPGADDGRFGFGAFAARYRPKNFNGEDTGWRDWSRVFRIWAGRFQ